jgi:O-antigen ligase
MRSFLKGHLSFLVVGSLLGAAVVIDPFIGNEVWFEIPITPLRDLLRIPFMPAVVFSGVLFFCGWVVPRVIVRRLRALDRLQWDQLLIFTLISTAFVNYWGLIHLHMTFMAVIGGFFILFFRGALAGRYDILKLPVDGYFILFFFFIVISVYGPLGGVLEVVGNSYRFFLGMILPVFFLHSVIRTRKQTEKVINYMIGLTIFSSAVGVLQFVLFRFFGIDMTGNWNLEYGRIVVLPVLGRFGRVGGLTGNSNYLALSTGTVTVMMSYFLVHTDYFTRAWRRTFLVGILLGLACSVFTVSRGSWLSIGLCYLIIPFLRWPRHWKKFVLAILIVCVVGLASGLFAYIYEQVHDIRTGALDYRARLMRLGIDALRNHTWTGVGFGMFGEYWNFDEAEVHNIWINFYTQIGLPGTLVLVAYFLSVNFRLLRGVSRSRGFNRIVLQAFCLGMVFFLVTSLVRPLIWSKFYWFYFGIVEAAIFTLGRGRMESEVYYPVFGYSWREEPAHRVRRTLRSAVARGPRRVS